MFTWIPIVSQHPQRVGIVSAASFGSTLRCLLGSLHRVWKVSAGYPNRIFRVPAVCFVATRNFFRSTWVSAACLESNCSVFRWVFTVCSGVRAAYFKYISVFGGARSVLVSTTCFRGSSVAYFGVIRHRILGLLSREKHIRIQVWLRQVFRVACCKFFFRVGGALKGSTRSPHYFQILGWGELLYSPRSMFRGSQQTCAYSLVNWGLLWVKGTLSSPSPCPRSASAGDHWL